MGLIRKLIWTGVFGFGFVTYTGYVFNIGREYEANERTRNNPRINLTRRLTKDALDTAEGISEKIEYCKKKVQEYNSKEGKAEDDQMEPQQALYSNEIDGLRDDLKTKLDKM